MIRGSIVSDDSVKSFYLIHQVGKVASEALEATILKAIDSSTSLERVHYLAQSGVSTLDWMCSLPGIDLDSVAVVRRQADRARAVRERLQALDPARVCVMTGIRDPLEQVISSFFQDLPVYCPWIDHGQEIKGCEVETLIEFFNSEFDQMIGDSPIETFSQGLLNLKLKGQQFWFENEFTGMYDVDPYSIRMAPSEPFAICAGADMQIVVYRTEALSSALDSLFCAAGLPAVAKLEDRNIGRNKTYAGIYRLFKSRFKPSTHVTDYYYGSRFYQKFYGGRKAAGCAA